MTNVNTIGKYRTQLMGLCIISVMLCHNTLQLSGKMQGLNSAARMFFQGGVDGFLILSGFGCFYSFYKCRNIKEYYSRRFIKIIPTYVLVILCYAVFSVWIVKDVSLSQFWHAYNLITFWTEGVLREWYVAAILALYVTSPLFFYLADRNRSVYKVLMALAVCIPYVLILIDLPVNLLIINEIFICRVPAFMFGILIASWGQMESAHRDSKLGWSILLLVLIISVWAIIYNSQIACKTILLRMLFTPMCIVFFVLTSAAMDKVRYKGHMLAWLGGLTLEIYLLHEKMLGISYYVCHRLIRTPFISSVVENIMAVTVSAIGAYLLHSLVNLLLSKWRTIKVS